MCSQIIFLIYCILKKKQLRSIILLNLITAEIPSFMIIYTLRLFIAERLSKILQSCKRSCVHKLSLYAVYWKEQQRAIIPLNLVAAKIPSFTFIYMHPHIKATHPWKFEQNHPIHVRGVAFTNFLYILYSEKTSKGHNSAKFGHS